jgi:hypothetical protein
MQYIPAVIPADLAATRAGLLWAAANIAVTDPDVDDAIAEAATHAGVLGAPAHSDADARAVEIAHSRVPSAQLNPAWPSSKWRTWQAAIDEAWPILADAAASAESGSDRNIGLVAGRWEA